MKTPTETPQTMIIPLEAGFELKFEYLMELGKLSFRRFSLIAGIEGEELPIGQQVASALIFDRNTREGETFGDALKLYLSRRELKKWFKTREITDLDKTISEVKQITVFTQPAPPSIPSAEEESSAPQSNQTETDSLKSRILAGIDKARERLIYIPEVDISRNELPNALAIVWNSLGDDEHYIATPPMKEGKVNIQARSRAKASPLWWLTLNVKDSQ